MFEMAAIFLKTESCLFTDVLGHFPYTLFREIFNDFIDFCDDFISVWLIQVMNLTLTLTPKAVVKWIKVRGVGSPKVIQA